MSFFKSNNSNVSIFFTSLIYLFFYVFWEKHNKGGKCIEIIHAYYTIFFYYLSIDYVKTTSNFITNCSKNELRLKK